MAQRARRERERVEKEYSAYQVGQRLRRERERSGQCVQPREPTYFPSLTPDSRRRICLEVIQTAKKRAMVTHSSITTFSMASTSSALPMNR